MAKQKKAPKKGPRCSAITKDGKRCKKKCWKFGDAVKCKQHQRQEFKKSDKYSIINYRYTHPSKYAVGGLGASKDNSISFLD